MCFWVLLISLGYIFFVAYQRIQNWIEESTVVSIVSNLTHFNHLNLIYKFMSFIENYLVRSKSVLQENLRWASEVQAISRTSTNTRIQNLLMVSDMKLICRLWWYVFWVLWVNESASRFKYFPSMMLQNSDLRFDKQAPTSEFTESVYQIDIE